MEGLLKIINDPEVFGPLSQMVTHIIGFFIFFWILKKFGWKPILKVIDERRSKIEQEFKTIDNLKEQVKKLEIDYNQKINEIEKISKEKTLEGINLGKKIAEEIVQKAHQESENIIARGSQNVHFEYLKAKKMIKEDVVRMVLLTTEKLMVEKLDHEKQHHLISQFIDELEQETKKGQ